MKPETNYLPSSCPLVTDRFTPAGVVHACRFDPDFLRHAIDDRFLEANTGCPLIRQCKLASPWPGLAKMAENRLSDSFLNA